METGNAHATELGSFATDQRAGALPSHEVAYTAGFFDGEGCVNIARYLKRGRPYHTLAIIFTNTDFQVLAWLQKRWGGNVFKPSRLSGRRPYGHLRLSAGPARPLLEAMLPYLIIKKSQVEIALEFIESKSVNQGRRGDPLAIAKRAALAARMPRPRAQLHVHKVDILRPTEYGQANERPGYVDRGLAPDAG